MTPARSEQRTEAQCPRAIDRQTHWRAWAIMLTLEQDPRRYMHTSIIAANLKRAGWAVFAHQYTNPRAACYRTLIKMEEEGNVERDPSLNAEIRWRLTERGSMFVRGLLIDNPHITPAKSQERWF